MKAIECRLLSFRFEGKHPLSLMDYVNQKCVTKAYAGYIE
jgi:hypothetical protein